MGDCKKIGIIVGSLRKDSYNLKIAKKAKEMLSENYQVVIGDIGGLPLYNEDLDHNNPPIQWTNFRKDVSSWDSILFVTAEYNRSMPAAIKNALDVASRPYGENMWAGKPGAIISSSTGGMGGFGANHHLRQSATFLDIYMMQQPERYLSNIASSFEDEKSESSLNNFLKEFVESYIKWIEIF